ncbi:unnamed protein product [Effrenium voratum]|nr:unnamed protein product [Effrenium voratum]
MAGDQGDSLAPNRRTQKACLRRYRQASEEVFAVVQRHAARCEMAGLDEVYLDLTDEAAQRLESDAASLAASCVCAGEATADAAADGHLLAAWDMVQHLRDDILAETGAVSAGIAGSKLVAKLASACHKPNRQTLVPSAGVLPFMASVQLKDLRGLGGKLGHKLRSALQLDPEAPGAELQKVPLAELQRIVGEQSAAFVHRLCRGEDSEEVRGGELKRKQYLSFKSLFPAAESLPALEPWLASLAAELVSRVREDPARRPRVLVLHHRGRLDAEHGKNWVEGRELTKTISRSCAFPELGGEVGPSAATVVADAARKLLLERVSQPFPCSRLALGASDFRKMEHQASRITAFFTAKEPNEPNELNEAEEALTEADDAESAEQVEQGAGSEPEASKPGVKDVLPANVAEFHRASRLHFLGTWRERFERWRAGGAGLPELAQQLQQELNALYDASASNTIWAHLDMDCFFVSVASRDAGASEDVPAAVVSGLGPSSEICSANYAARRAGVNTHLWSVERALEVFPSLRLMPISSELLRSVEETWKKVYGLLVAAVGADNVLMRSCDEAALRLQGFPDPIAWAEALRRAVRQNTGCSCSVGLGPSQLVAKLATKACKPNGVRQVLDAEVSNFMAAIPLQDMPQVGRSMAAKLQERGLNTCSDIQALEKKRLREWLGVKGETLWLNAQGLDQESSLVPAQRKSVSAEMNWGIRCQDRPAVLKILGEVARQLSERLAACSFRASHLTLKLKIAIPGWVEPFKKGGHGQCEDVSRSTPLASSELAGLTRAAEELFDLLKPDPVRVRGIGLSTRGANSDVSTRSPKKASGAASSGLARWLRKADVPVEQATAAAVQDQVEVVDLECSQEGQKSVACPVCAKLLPAGEVEAHVNSHFDDAPAQPPPAKRARGADRVCEVGGASDSECELIS